MRKLFEDLFLKKCPSCSTILKKEKLQEGHSCKCGYEWEGVSVQLPQTN